MKNKNLDKQIADAIAVFWRTRDNQQARGGGDGTQAYAGSRGAVVGGGHLDGFLSVVRGLLEGSGISADSIHLRKSKTILPGFFRATKCWDLVVVHKKTLVAIMEFKSQVGSFGNNFNNRIEESLGNATDILTAYREGAFAPSPAPWMGYVMLLEDCPGSRSPVTVDEPHFPAFKEYAGASYARRYELFCQKLVRERLYSAAAFILTPRPANATTVTYTEPSDELSFSRFYSSLEAHATSIVKSC